MIVTWLALALALAGAGPVRSETIVYRHIPAGLCFGCAETTLTLEPGGKAQLRVYRRDDKTTRVRDLTLTREQLAALRDRVAPYRPEGKRWIDEPNCAVYGTDDDVYEVEWRAAGKPTRLLHLYGGCDTDKNLAMIQALRGLAARLPADAGK